MEISSRKNTVKCTPFALAAPWRQFGGQVEYLMVICFATRNIIKILNIVHFRENIIGKTQKVKNNTKLIGKSLRLITMILV